MSDMDPLQVILDAIKRVEDRMSTLVTTETHRADIRRLDEAQTAERRRLDALLADITGDIATIRHERIEREAALMSGIEQLRESLQAEAQTRQAGDDRDLATIRAELKAEKDRRTADRKWLLGFLVAVAAVAVTAIAAVLA